MDVIKFFIATVGVFCTPFFQGILLAMLLHAVVLISTQSNFTFRTNLWMRVASHLMAATIGTRVVLMLMHALGYNAGWIWVLVVSLYFIHNYFFRRSRGTLTPDAAFLLIFNLLGIWLGYGNYLG